MQPHHVAIIKGVCCARRRLLCLHEEDKTLFSAGFYANHLDVIFPCFRAPIPNTQSSPFQPPGIRTRTKHTKFTAFIQLRIKRQFESYLLLGRKFPSPLEMTGSTHHDTPKRGGTIEFLECQNALVTHATHATRGAPRWSNLDVFDCFGVFHAEGYRMLESRLEEDRLQPLGVQSDPDARMLDHDPRFQEPRHSPTRFSREDAQHA